ncbi:MAG: hypothetical protein KC425_12545 [Anaerolineales bacterium]|nr:hypothetical protein [Anaerolineales bacterium]
MELDAIARVQASLAQIRPHEAAFITLFYNRLFALDPALRPFFPDDVTAHGLLVLTMLRQGVAGLGTPAAIIPAVKDVGRAHARHGVQPHHYHAFGQALLWTLAQLLGDAFTPDLADAWQEAFYLLAGLMKEAARSP